MRSFVIILNLAALLVVNVAADKLFCPPNSKGEYPKCICHEDYPYDQVNNLCSIRIDINQICPKGSAGNFPNCVCKEGKVYVPQTSECVVVDKTQCPLGSQKVNNQCLCADKNGFKYEFDEIFWICRPWYIPTTTPEPIKCKETHQHWDGEKCVWDHCPAGYTSKLGYWPDCVAPPTCHQKGLIGQWPNCYQGEVHHHCAYHQTGTYPDCHWLPCPDTYKTKSGYWPDCAAPPSCADRGLVGKYPDCHPLPPTCPPHHHRNKDGECVRIPCPPGHEGDYQPNCKNVPKCPKEYPGVWPACNIYASTPRNTYIPPEPTPAPRTTTTARTTTTTRTTPAPRCHCDCYSNEIVVFRDNVVRDPSRKYKRSSNVKPEEN